MKNIHLFLIAILTIALTGVSTAQNSQKTWVDAGKSVFLKIPTAEKGKAGPETVTETRDFDDEKGAARVIVRSNPDGKIVSVEVIPQRRMQINLNPTSKTEGYIATCCDMCFQLGYGLCCCFWCRINGY